MTLRPEPEPTVLVDRDGGVTWVTLNRPAALNATTEQMHGELYDAFSAASADPGCHALVLTGAGEQAFCIGSDLGFLGTAPPGEDPGPEPFEAYLGRLDQVVSALEQVPVPTIAMVQGQARASGFELAVACDLMLIAAETRIGDVHTPHGQLPGVGGTRRAVRRLGLQRALELLWTGRWLSAAEAVELGLALRAVPADRLRAETAELAHRLAGMPAERVRHIKAAAYGGHSAGDRPTADDVAGETEEYLRLLRSFSRPADGRGATPG